MDAHIFSPCITGKDLLAICCLFIGRSLLFYTLGACLLWLSTLGRSKLLLVLWFLARESEKKCRKGVENPRVRLCCIEELVEELTRSILRSLVEVLVSNETRKTGPSLDGALLSIGTQLWLTSSDEQGAKAILIP